MAEAGGVIRDGRILGMLNVARALGDKSFKKAANNRMSARWKEDLVSSRPWINCFPLKEEDEFMLISCDGLWYISKA